jgi:protein ImuB
MDRLACVDVPALPLQILARAHADWARFPLAVVDQDTPQGIVLWANEKAWRSGIRSGMRHADALSLAATLRAGCVTRSAIEEGVETIARLLDRFSPALEPSAEMPGVFWLDASGLELLYSSLEDWARSLAEVLGKAGFHSRVVVGFTRFGTYAAARARARERQALVFDGAHQEEELALRTPLERLGLEPKLRDLLSKLGIHTVGTFLRLPPSGLLERFGPEAYRLHRMASGDLWTPLTRRVVEEPVGDTAILDEPVLDVVVLLGIAGRMLAPVLESLARKQRAVAALHFLLALDTKENVIETVRPAVPTLDMKVLIELLQLRLHAGRLPAGVREIEMRVEYATASCEQINLFAASLKRDLAAAARALARVRADLGETAVVRARLREGHLPEAGFAWEPWNGPITLGRAHPRKVAVRTLVRRIQARAIPLPPRPPSERNDNWLMQGLEVGPVVRMLGPYVVSGGWWHTTVHREYHFVETRRGDILWVYYDRRRRRWYLQGRVE